MDVFLTALQQGCSITAILLTSLGVLFGTILGALPGLGAIVGISVILPFTFSMDSVQAVGLMLGVYAGSIYGGSISSVLINTPGTPQSACTAFDGYPMAQQGKADQAIGWATASSVFGGIVSCLLFLLCAPQLAAFSSKFGAVELTALIFLGLSSICTLSQGSIVKGVFSGIVGLSLALIGQDPITGDIRFTFDIYHLLNGIELIPVVVGAFAISEVLGRVEAIARCEVLNPISCTRMVLPGLRSIVKHFRTLIKSSFIGILIGILPGAGSAAAAFISYGEAKRSSAHPETFGTGEPEGVIAPESANNAVTGGALVPAMALGIPGDAVTAIMLATLILHGVVPGVRLMEESPVIVYSAFFTLIVANVMLIPVGMLVMRGFSQLLRLPEPLFLPFITLICLLGVYSARGNGMDLVVAFGAGVMGITFRYFAIPIAPMVIAMVLGAPFEFSLRQMLLLTSGNKMSLLTDHPIALVLVLITVLIQLWPWFSTRKGARCRKPVPA